MTFNDSEDAFHDILTDYILCYCGIKKMEMCLLRWTESTLLDGYRKSKKLTFEGGCPSSVNSLSKTLEC